MLCEGVPRRMPSEAFVVAAASCSLNTAFVMPCPVRRNASIGAIPASRSVTNDEVKKNMLLATSTLPINREPK